MHNHVENIGDLARVQRGTPRGKGQLVIMAELARVAPDGAAVNLSELATAPAFRRLHYHGIMRAAEGLGRKHLIRYDAAAGTVALEGDR
jgi:hypothetical protein